MYSDEQSAFIHADGKRLLLEAVAGSGKTHAVAGRVLEQERLGKRVLVLAYTRSAVSTIGNRLLNAGSQTQVKTVSAYALEVLRRAIGDTFDYGDGKDIAAEIAARSPISVKDILSYEALRSANAPLPRDITALTVEHFEKYQALKREKRYLSFIDITHAAIHALTDKPSALVREHFDEIIVDEGQDLSPSQAAFLELLDTDTLTLAGDRNQSIFDFGGVDPELFERFGQTAEVLHLSTSYRCPPAITEHISETFDITMRSAADSSNDGVLTRIHGTPTETTEWMVENIQPGSVILAPTKRQLERAAKKLSESRPELPIWRFWEEAVLPREAVITLASVHTAKGDEWENVYLMDTRGYETFWTPHDKEHDYESRLMYVAASRTFRNLFVLDTTPDTDETIKGEI